MRKTTNKSLTIKTHRIPNTHEDFDKMGEMGDHFQSENDFRTDFNEDFLNSGQNTGGRSGKVTHTQESGFKGTTHFNTQGMSLQDTQVFQGG